MAKPDYIELTRERRLPILYEDRSVLAVDKPAGWMLVPVSWQRTAWNLQAAILSSIAAGHFWARSRNLKFLKYVHRLDAETSGVLLFAKSPGALRTFGDLFETRRMEKVYLAVINRAPKQERWTCRLSLAPDKERIGRVRVDPKGKPAETDFRLVTSAGDRHLIEARPYTGRTHQIRLHLAAAGCPIVGDEIYGRPDAAGMGLRAVGLAYVDPFARRPVAIRASVDEFLVKFGFPADAFSVQFTTQHRKSPSRPEGKRLPQLDSVQRASQEQFARQSERYGKGHILQNVDDVRAALEHLALPARARVLDVATGAGHTGLFFASLGHDVTLADIAQPMLDAANRAARDRGLKVATCLHAAEEFPHEAKSFDLVTCRVAAHHFSSPETFVRESARVLRPGGSLLVIDGTVEDDHAEAEEWMHQVEKLRDPSHHRFITPLKWRRFCDSAGLRVIHCGIAPFKQPDLNWYFETANTPAKNRQRVLDLVNHAPESVRRLFRVGHEDGRIVWWWQRLTLVARRS